MIKSFFAALSFISRLPVPARLSQGLEIEQYQRSIVTFPLVGLLLGAIAGAVALLLQPWCGVPLAALFGVLALALLTGGFHLDGLADTCDGIFSARTRDRMLEIMRDSRLGTHGGLALIFVLVGIFAPTDVMGAMPVFTGTGFGMVEVPVGVIFFTLCGLCTSVMWGTIFNLAVEGLGKYTSMGSGIFMVMVCGGGILPLIQGGVADFAGYLSSYWVVVAGLAYMLFYALVGSKNVNKDIPVED